MRTVRIKLPILAQPSTKLWQLLILELLRLSRKRPPAERTMSVDFCVFKFVASLRGAVGV